MRKHGSMLLYVHRNRPMFARFAVTAMYRVTCFYEMRTQRVSWQLYVNDYYFRNKAMISALDGVFYGCCFF